MKKLLFKMHMLCSEMPFKDTYSKELIVQVSKESCTSELFMHKNIKSNLLQNIKTA